MVGLVTIVTEAPNATGEPSIVMELFASFALVIDPANLAFVIAKSSIAAASTASASNDLDFILLFAIVI